jgi:hypothetical protein
VWQTVLGSLSMPVQSIGHSERIQTRPPFFDAPLSWVMDHELVVECRQVAKARFGSFTDIVEEVLRVGSRLVLIRVCACHIGLSLPADRKSTCLASATTYVAIG